MPKIMDIVTPLGADVLLFHNLRGTERLGRLYDYTVGLLSTRNDIDPKALLGKNATVKIRLPKGGPRCIDGCVTRFALVGSHGRYARYEMQLRPWMWFLTRASDCRIFQNEKVPDILKKIFAKYPNAAIEERLTGSYEPWVYCVQYRETDYNFVARLMEQEGIYTWYKHSEGKHTLVLCDSPAAHDPYPGYASIGFVADQRSIGTEKERILDWACGAEVQTGKYVIDEYDFTKPATELQQKTLHKREHEQAEHEIYDWPGDYDTLGEGESYVRLRMEELQAGHERASAVTNARGIHCGATFTLKSHPRADQNKPWLIVATHLELSSNEHETAAQSGATFNASVEAIPAATQYRSPRETPKPLIQGLQTAKVVGPAGEEIYTDEYGRVKVHFHWDRYGQENENDSCWIRVSHPWAGKNYGGIHIPRIGQEVVVEFMEGDPDRPLITGRVYNAQQMPPWKLPDNKTQSGTLSNWSIGGGGASMLRFEDKKGIEHLELSNTYGQTHLHMGYLMNQGSGAQRGYGFELRTNLWGAIRADKGLLISTYTQDFTSKVANDSPDGLEHMGSALSNTSSLMEEASQAVSTAKDMIGALCSGKAAQISGMVSTLSSMFKGGGGAMAAAGACWDSLAGGGPGGDGGGEVGMPADADPAMPDAQRMMTLSKDIGQPIVSIVSPEGQTMISPKPVVISSGQSTSVHAQQHVTISSGAQLTQLSRSGMFTHVTSGGQVNVVSAGDVATTAKTGAMNLVAQKDVTIASTTANANVIARQKIVMNAQSSDILANAAQGVAVTSGHTIALVAGDSISLVCGQASITLRKDGTIELIGRDIKLKGTGEGRVEFDGELIQNGSKINLNC